MPKFVSGEYVLVILVDGQYVVSNAFSITEDQVIELFTNRKY